MLALKGLIVLRRREHPYLYFTADDIPDLKEKLGHPWMQKKWATFLDRGKRLLSEDTYPEPSMDPSQGSFRMAVGEGSLQFTRRVPLLAFLYLLTDDSMEHDGVTTNAGFAFFSPIGKPERILLGEADFLSINDASYLICDRPVTIGLEYTDDGFAGHIKTTTRVYLQLHIPRCPDSIAIDGEPVEFDYDPKRELALFVVHRGVFKISGIVGSLGEKPKHLRRFPSKREIIF